MIEAPDDEGTDFVAAMKRQYRQAPAGSSTKERLKAERRAGRTPKQRVKRAKKPHALNFRASEQTFALVVGLMAKRKAEGLEDDKTAVLEQAVACLAAKEGVKLGD